MKRSEIFFSSIRVPIDFLMLFLAAVTAYIIRDLPQILTLKDKMYNFPFGDFAYSILMVIPLFLIIYAFEGLYSARVTRKFSQEVYSVFKATSIGLVIIIVAIFLDREWFSSRFIILSAWVLSVVYVSSARFLLKNIQKYLLVTYGIGRHRVLLINGNTKKTTYFQELLKSRRDLGYYVVETISEINLHVIKRIRKELGIDEIILCDPSTPDDLQEKLIDYCAIHGIGYSYVPTSLQQTSLFDIRFLGDEPLFEVQHTPIDGWGKVMKRSFDIVGSIVLIVLFSPIMLVAALAIWLESGRPIVFRNERIGSNGEKFFVYKFRYMKLEYCTGKENPNWRKALAHEAELIKKQSVRKGPVYKIKNDPRKTQVGRFIERYSIDELLQFFNVLRGDMSLVGPRPHQEREVNKYREYHRRLLTIKPGLTGLAQISGRSDLDFEDEYKLDVFYIEKWSLWLDVAICFKTPLTLLSRRKN